MLLQCIILLLIYVVPYHSIHSLANLNPILLLSLCVSSICYYTLSLDHNYCHSDISSLCCYTISLCYCISVVFTLHPHYDLLFVPVLFFFGPCILLLPSRYLQNQHSCVVVLGPVSSLTIHPPQHKGNQQIKLLCNILASISLQCPFSTPFSFDFVSMMFT